MKRERTLGVIGTLVWDRIRTTASDEAPLEDWGGMAYSLCALAACSPPGWAVRVIAKVGRDLEAEARAFLAGLPRIDDFALVVVPEANNRVAIDYLDASRRVEHLTGGVPPWREGELLAAVEGCDALYVNFISGHEMALETALALRGAFGGPMYTDLHSLFLGTDSLGGRYPRPLESRDAWLRCSDVIQLNEEEAALLMGVASTTHLGTALGEGLGMIAVTLGVRGAAYVALPGFSLRSGVWDSAAGHESRGRAHEGTVTVGVTATRGDPTGCGDVWGATMFAALLGGATTEEAMAEANRLASVNAACRGTKGLVRRFARADTKRGKPSDWTLGDEVRS